MKKICIKCQQKKDLSEFKKRKENKDGCSNTCKVCINGHTRQYRIINKDKINEQKRNLRSKNPEKYRNHSRKWYDRHREEHIERNMKKYHKQCRIDN